MKDKNGNPMGVLAHLTETHVTNNTGYDMLSALNKDLGDTKIDDQFSNEDILSYTYPQEVTNKQNPLLDAVDAETGKEKYSEMKDEGGQVDLSNRPNTSNTGLMD